MPLIAMYRMHPMRWAMVGLGVILLIIGSIWFLSGIYRPGFYTGGYYGMPMMRWGSDWFIGAGLIGFILVVFLVTMAIRYMAGSPMNNGMCCRASGMGYSREAEEILRQRYARGEISKNQYDQMLRDLREERN